jgi:hypothetical protein
MSELDAARRSRLVDVLLAGGQSVVTATELAHVPGAEDPGVERVAIAEGRVLQAAGDDADEPPSPGDETPEGAVTGGDRPHQEAKARGSHAA